VDPEEDEGFLRRRRILGLPEALQGSEGFINGGGGVSGGGSVPKRGFAVDLKKGVQEERGSNPGFGYGLSEEGREKVVQEATGESRRVFKAGQSDQDMR
jgi:hypothetical protein